MCRWMARLGQPVLMEEVLFKTQHGIIDQSLHARMGAEPTNGDGFGLGWYGTGEGPARYRGVSLDRPPVSDMARNPETRAVVAAVRDYVENLGERLDEGRGLWLSGDVGTGKTTLAMIVSSEAARAGRSVAIYSLPRLLARIRRTYDADAGEDSYLAFFERLTSVDLLHIDDLGAEKRSDWVLEQLYAIVDERYVSRRAMVVTTNLDESALEEQIGPRTVSRLVEICGDPLTLFGADNRYRLA